jgi:hypothetical protein
MPNMQDAVQQRSWFIATALRAMHISSSKPIACLTWYVAQHCKQDVDQQVLQQQWRQVEGHTQNILSIGWSAE